MNRKYEYTLEDCQCCYCLHYNPQTQDCDQEVCCCLEEKRAALARLRRGEQPRAEQCRV